MKFLYQYRTPDNKAHSGVIAAADRDAAFATLKASGIKPFGIEEAPGLSNKLFGKGKRWMVIFVLAVASAFLSCYTIRLKRSVVAVTPAVSSPRHQIYGDPAVVAEMESSEFASVFEGLGERFLASYAQPGRERRFGVRRFDHDLIVQSVAASLTNDVAFVDGEPAEVAEIKRIVNWIKDEMRECIAGGDTIESYLEQLEIRQQEERQIYQRVMNELAETADGAVWESRNSALRALGLRTVPRVKKPREKK